MTPAQLTTLKAAILADSALNAYPLTADGSYDMCRDKLNVAADPAFIVWQDRLLPSMYEDAMIAGATQIDALTQGKRDELFLIGKSVRDCNNTAVRAAIDDATGSQTTLKAALVAATKRSATYGEKIFATGTGTTLSPATLVWYGPIAYNDVTAARNS